jgi:hypothetical protein
MANVAHNGFGCPYCRTELTDKKTKRTRQVYDDSDSDSEYDDDDEDSVYGDDALLALRFFTNNLNGEEHDPDDVEEEEANLREAARFTMIRSETMMEKLVAKGITMKDVVKIVWLNDDPFGRLLEITR